MPRETLRLLPRTVIPSAAEGSPLQAGKRWVFDDEKREVSILPPRTPVVISGVQERFLDFARNDDTGKALSSEPRNLKAGIRDEWLVTRENAEAASPHRHPERSRVMLLS